MPRVLGLLITENRNTVQLSKCCNWFSESVILGPYGSILGSRYIGRWLIGGSQSLVLQAL